MVAVLGNIGFVAEVWSGGLKFASFRELFPKFKAACSNVTQTLRHGKRKRSERNVNEDHENKSRLKLHPHNNKHKI